MNQAYVHGILLGYEVRYAKDDGSPQLTWKTKKLDADTHEVVLRDLEYFTRYKVVVCAKTSKGCGKEYSDIAYTYGNGKLNTNEAYTRKFQLCITAPFNDMRTLFNQRLPTWRLHTKHCNFLQIIFVITRL